MLIELIKNLGIYLSLFRLLEQGWPLHQGATGFKRKGYLTDLAHYFITQLLSTMLLTAIWQAMSEIAYYSGLTYPVGLCTKWPWWLQLGLMFLSNEVIGYFYHRASHTLPALWKLHAVHHSSEQLDWLAAVRFHPLDLVLSRSLKYIPLVATGFSFAPAPFAFFLFLDTLQGYFIHANLRLKLKCLSWLVVTPQFHHWHHSRQLVDKNFGGLFPWLDLLFGTFYLPLPAPVGKPPGVAKEAKDRSNVSLIAIETVTQELQAIRVQDMEWPSQYGTTELVGNSYLQHLAYPVIAFVTRPQTKKR
jgi:sterol desaturase/sphingolipid hydroxylase (fatty acid hydroxylase superfamily)